MVIVGNAKEFQPMVVGVRMTMRRRLAGFVGLAEVGLVSFPTLLALQVRHGIGIIVSVRILLIHVAVLGVPGYLTPLQSALG